MGSIHNPNDREIVVPEEVPGRPGVYYCPENKYIGFTKDGKVYSLVTGKILKPRKNAIGRSVINFKHLEPKKYARGLYYRLLARTFIGRPLCHIDKEYRDLEVNHIDLNPLNNSLDNLEWCTHAENNEHSRINNKERKDQKTIEIKNIETEEIVNLRSIKHASNYLSENYKRIVRATIGYRLMDDIRGFKFGNYLIRHKGNGFDWGDIISECIYRKITTRHRIQIDIKNIKINLEKSFKNMSQCADYLGIEKFSFIESITRESYKRRIYGNWLIKKSTDKDWPNIDLCRISKLLTNDIKSIYIKFKNDNTVWVYNNIYELSDKHHIAIDTVLTSFSNNSQYETNKYIIGLLTNINSN